MVSVNAKILQRVDTGANWTTANPILADKEQGFDSTIKKYKIGDGVTHWLDLLYWSDSGTQIVINLTSSDAADYDYHYTGPATLTNLKIQAWQPFTDGAYGAVYVPYAITPLLIMSTGHIILRRSDVGDVVRVVIST